MDDYPKDLNLIQLVFIHRHGQRTPLYPEYSNALYPSLWNNCSITPFIHAFYQSIHSDSLTPREHSPDYPAQERPLTPFYLSSIEKSSDSNHLTLDSFKQYKQAINTQPLCFYGQLTDTGKRNLYSLGSSLRNLYVKKLAFLDSKLNIPDIYTRSTDYSRTIESVHFLLGGLYPSSTRTTDQHIPLHIRRHTDETMYPHTACALLTKETKQLREKMHHENISLITNTFDTLKHLGLQSVSSSNLNAVHRVYDFFACLEGHGISFPRQIGNHDTLMKNLETMAVKTWCDIYNSPNMARLAIGRFLPEIKEKIIEAVHNHPDKVKLALFSGHDSTISPLLSAFEVFNGEYPGFASNIALEIFEKPNNLSSLDNSGKRHYVRMLYNGNALQVPTCQGYGNHKPGDKTMCTLEAFIKKMDEMTPKDYVKECECSEQVKADWDD